MIYNTQNSSYSQLTTQQDNLRDHTIQYTYKAPFHYTDVMIYPANIFQ